jgi:hypothetical protein
VPPFYYIGKGVGGGAWEVETVRSANFSRCILQYQTTGAVTDPDNFDANPDVKIFYKKFLHNNGL